MNTRVTYWFSLSSVRILHVELKLNVESEVGLPTRLSRNKASIHRNANESEGKSPL